jgi:HK97 family phage portal protein
VAWLDRFRLGRKSGVATLELFREIYGRLYGTKSGRTVTLDTALQVSAVFGCARVLGNGMAQVPLQLMRKDGRTRLPAEDHPLYDVMGRKPNPWQTSFEFRETMSWHVELAGRFIAFKNAPAGRIVELIPFEPDKVRVDRKPDKSLVYMVRGESGDEVPFPEEAIWHVRGPSWNGWSALNPLRAARDAIGLAISIEEAQAGLHSNGVQTSGAWSVEGKLTPDQYKALREWIDKEHAGSPNSAKAMIMDRAAKWVSTQMSGVDAQTLESRREQIAEVCRFMGVMPIMVGHTDKVATYASAEQMFLAHVVHTLSPRWERYEQSMDAYLLTEKERKAGYYFNFVEEEMLRGSVKDMQSAIDGYVNGGIMTPNEGREKLDLNPDPDPVSDELRIPVTTVQDPHAVDPDADEGAARGKSAYSQTQIVFAEGAFKVSAQITTPEVKVANNVEPTPIVVEAPIVHNHVNPTAITVKNDVKPAEVTVVQAAEMKITAMPARKATSKTERDEKGNITRVEQTERDA